MHLHNLSKVELVFHIYTAVVKVVFHLCIKRCFIIDDELIFTEIILHIAKEIFIVGLDGILALILFYKIVKAFVDIGFTCKACCMVAAVCVCMNMRFDSPCIHYRSRKSFKYPDFCRSMVYDIRREILFCYPFTFCHRIVTRPFR